MSAVIDLVFFLIVGYGIGLILGIILNASKRQ